MKIKKGDGVRMSSKFLKNTGEPATSILWRKRGDVIRVEEVCAGFTLAVVDWRDTQEPQKININNLVPERYLEA